MSGADAVAVLKAILDGQEYPGTLEATPALRALWDATAADVERITARGWVPDVPWDWTEMPDDEPSAQTISGQLEQY